MTANENQVEVKDLSEHENRLKNAQPKYLTEGKKSYLLASSEESLQSLMDNQKAELTKVLIALKSEHDQITLESDKIKRQIDEYDKQINMILDSEKAAKEREEKQKQDLDLYSKEIAKFVFGEADYLGYRDPKHPYTDADTPGGIFLDIVKKEVNPLLEKAPNLKDLTEKKIKAIKDIISEVQEMKEKQKFNFY